MSQQRCSCDVMQAFNLDFRTPGDFTNTQSDTVKGSSMIDTNESVHSTRKLGQDACAGGFWAPYAAYMSVGLAYAVVAGSLVAFVEPLAGGSGIPEVSPFTCVSPLHRSSPGEGCNVPEASHSRTNHLLWHITRRLRVDGCRYPALVRAKDSEGPRS